MLKNIKIIACGVAFATLGVSTAFANELASCVLVDKGYDWNDPHCNPTFAGGQKIHYPNLNVQVFSSVWPEPSCNNIYGSPGGGSFDTMKAYLRRLCGVNANTCITNVKVGASISDNFISTSGPVQELHLQFSFNCGHLQ